MLLDFLSVEYGGVPPSIKAGGDDAWKHRKYLKRQQELIEARLEEKVSQRVELRRQIEMAFNPEAIIVTQEVTEIANKREIVDKLPFLEAQIDLLEKEIIIIAKQMEIAKVEAKKVRDEDDITALLLTIH